MVNDLQIEIRKDKQIKKFCAYGFLKDLRFFEPYLLIFLMDKGIDIFQIGILIAIRELIINIFEIPSGFIADYFGRKKELYFSFSFYIISFIFFLYTRSFTLALIAMIFFGLGEAFRSGTHKAMIYTYLDHKNWQSEKTFVYGRTRSFSLLGSAISSFLGIIIILTIPSINLIFLFSIIPYILDLFLIMSYPKYLDVADKSNTKRPVVLLKDFYSNFKNNNCLRNILVEEGIFKSTISFIKDLIQPILEAIIIGSNVIILSRLSAENNLKVILGIVYIFLNLFGAFFSKKAYIIKKDKSNIKCLIGIHLFLALSMAVLGLVSKNPIFVFVIYIFIYIIFNIRQPIFVDEIDNHIEKNERATILSAASLMKSLFLILFAPLFGFVAEKYGINIVMYILSGLFIISIPLLKIENN